MGRYQAYPEYKDSGLKWLGSMPAHWELLKAKYLFKREQREFQADAGVVTAFRDGQVTLRSKRRLDGFTESIKEIGYQGVRKGDLLVHAMDGFAGAIGVSDSDGKCSPVCSVCSPINFQRVYMPYYGYLVRQLAVTDFISSLAKGIRERSTEFRYSEFCVLELAVPKHDEQQAIANFLDHETAKIDTLIEQQQQLIQLLKEKRQAVISHAVTKGLSSLNSGPNAPMKDSGVEWLGAVPAHWNVCRLKQIIKSGSSISYGIVQPGDALEDGVPFIQTTNMSQGTFELDDLQKTTQEIASLYPRSRLEGGEVILGIRASIGAAFVVPEHLKGANLSRGVARIIPNTSITSSFLVLYFRSGSVERYWSLSKQGSTFSEVSIETVRELTIPIPPVTEQVEICNFVKSKLNVLDKAESNAVYQMQLLQERRTALISAAVTGKIDVRNWLGPTN